jgi:hypothetical protein
MQVLKSASGVNSLKRLAAVGSSARLMDLHALAAEKPKDPEYAERPLFVHPVLNRAIVVKHNLHWTEAHRLSTPRLNATKIIFPFDQKDLGLGGQALFIGQMDFIGALTRHLDYTDLSLSRDMAVLLAMDKLPTLDPFLVSEILAQKGIGVARCYFRFSKSDRAAMLAFVSAEIEALILSCFGELKANDKRARRLSQLLLSDHRSPELEPLRATFRMSETDFSEAMFAWKAFLYYRWRSNALAGMLRTTLASIGSIDALRYRRGELTFVLKAKPILEQNLVTTWREVGRRLRLYDRAFSSLTEKQQPDGFSSFLVQGSRLFVELGDRIGRLEHAVSFWNDRFGGERLAGLSPEEVLDGIRDLLQALSIQVVGLSTWTNLDRRGRARQLVHFTGETTVSL